MTFAEKLKQLREAASKSREELSLASGLSRGVIRDYEQGKREPTLRSAVKLADALGLSVEVFADSVRGNDQPRTRPKRETAPEEKEPRGRPRKPK